MSFCITTSLFEIANIYNFKVYANRTFIYLGKYSYLGFYCANYETGSTCIRLNYWELICCK